MREGEAQDCLDCLPRDDGGYYKTFGWRRINDSALTGRPIGARGFTYRGKNVDTAGGNTARTGNFGLADDGAVFTRRDDEFSSFLLLTDTNGYFWNAATETFDNVALPGGVSIDPDPKPSMQVFKESVYIVGWADINLRFDPTDRVFYPWGWESAPAAPTLAVAAGGTLIEEATYKYALAFFDLYTGEETTMGTIAEATTTSANRTINLSVIPAYAGSRHFNDLAVGTDSDVGVVVYRTNADDDTYYFLGTVNPGTTTFSDTGLAVDTSLEPWRGTMQDEPRFSALLEFKARLYALSKKSESNRLYYSSFTTSPFVERWEVRSFRDLPVPEGDTLTAIGKTDATLLVYTRKGAFRASVVEGADTPQIIHVRLPWEVGCVGPRARLTVRGWEYFMSDRGPYRWRDGVSDPQWIGENISPIFIDPTSGLCRFNESEREQTEVGFEWFSNTVRFVFAVDASTRPNAHYAYWIDAQERVGDYRLGWWPQSVEIQTMDQSVAIGQLDADGRPPNGDAHLEHLIFGDANGYVYEYDLTHKRGGLKEGAFARGFVVAGSTVSSLAVGGGLFTNGDGLTGLRVEVRDVSAGTVQIREVESNTDGAIVPTVDFDTAPATGDIWFVGGYPAFWRSWVDHLGDPQAHKSIRNLYLGYLRTGSDDTSETSLYEWLLDVSVGGGDFPTSFDRTRTAELSAYRKKLLVSLTNRFFVYEVANSRPDELFAITNIQRTAQGILEKRLI
jgi:hypothetical protein